MFLSNLLFGALALGLAGASVIPEAKLQAIESRQDETAAASNSASCNTPKNRTCWPGGFSVYTDSETKWPSPPPKQRTYTLVVSEKTLSPLGVPKTMLVVNGTYPGPTIYADWGDQLTITVINNLPKGGNGTSMHWHGIQQYMTNTADGVGGITECPIPPNGGSRTYQFIATQHGSTWYHSHISGQYGSGVLGMIQINGPAAVNYDVDLGFLPVADFYDDPFYVVEDIQGPPTSDGAVINGTMKDPNTGAGHYYNVTVQPNTTYRLRLINTAIDNGFVVSLDGHPFTVIAADLVPIKPYTTNWLKIMIGERYDVVFTTSAKPANYWFRATLPSPNCGSNAWTGKIFAIFNYAGVKLANPTSTSTTAVPTICGDESTLVPLTVKSVPQNQFNFTNTAADEFNTSVITGNGTTTWIVNQQAMSVSWEQPTLKYITDGNITGLDKVPSYSVIHLPVANKFYFWVIQNQFFAPHPMHLHGHDFYLLGQSNDTGALQTFTTADMGSLNFKNPTRRDSAMLPGYGWAVVAMYTDNPGAWLMHCHIATHIGLGFGVQFLERESEIPQLPNMNKISGDCKVWDNYYATDPYKQLDSGL
ncbi:Laccase-1 [Lachnellula suecica]|uniref:laccase n=1 Tax=Lachnellula suecica TaxID=602035 RepID=A0A8T9BWX4_9HELO|nr:Laccase-1 [Lachnellula suecica]